MSVDLINLISGFLPSGFYFLLIILFSFSVIWWTIWRGTGFWKKRRFFIVLIEGWVIILALYFYNWVRHRPPPIPIRVIVCAETPAGKNADDWRSVGLVDVLEKRLSASSKPFIVQSSDYVSFLKREYAVGSTLEKIARLSNVQWIIRIIPGAGNAYDLKILKRSGGGYKQLNSFEIKTAPFVEQANELIQQTLPVLGDKPSRSPKWDCSLPGLPDSEFEILFSAQRHRLKEEYSEALDYSAQAVWNSPNWKRPYQELAETFIDRHQNIYTDSVHSALMKAIELDKDDPETFLLLGRYFLEFNDWEEAEAALKIAYNLREDDPRILFNISRLADWRLQDIPWDSKYRIIERALILAPGYESARIALAKMYSNDLDVIISKRLLYEGLDIDSVSIPLLFSLSETLIKSSGGEESLEIANRILELKPGEPAALYNRGLSLFWLGDYDGAIACFDSSLANGGHEDNYFYLAFAYQKKGEFEKAIDNYHRRIAHPTGAYDQVMASSRLRLQRIQRLLASQDSTAAMDVDD